MSKERESKDIVSYLFKVGTGKGELKKLEIIKATIECLATLGIDKTTFDSIAKKIGTRKAHIAYYFPNKSDIYVEAIKYIYTFLLNFTENSLKNSTGGIDLFIKYIQASFRWGNLYPNQAKLLTLFYYLCSLDSVYKDLHARIQNNNEGQIGAIIRSELGLEYTEDELKMTARILQHVFNGELIAAVTIENYDHLQAEKNVIKAIERLLNIEILKIYEDQYV